MLRRYWRSKTCLRCREDAEEFFSVAVMVSTVRVPNADRKQKLVSVLECCAKCATGKEAAAKLLQGAKDALESIAKRKAAEQKNFTRAQIAFVKTGRRNG